VNHMIVHTRPPTSNTPPFFLSNDPAPTQIYTLSLHDALPIFATGPDAIMEEINASIGFDQRLYRQDIAGSIAHATMLAETGILTQADRDAIIAGLTEVLEEIESGTFTFSRALEDIHMNVESRLREKIGDAAGRLHTARSRNDQVATDFKLYVRDTIDTLVSQVSGLQLALVERAEDEADTIMPGFTHLQN